jgi:uncharacterized coiled-coil DUF342 family protein
MKIEIIKGSENPVAQFFSAPSSTPETDACLSAARGESLEDLCRRLERERDETQKKYDILATENMLEVNKLCNERDEALNAIHTYRCEVEAWEILNKTRQERDEAKHEIEGWKNKWECAVEMAARAENERDEYRALLIKLYNDINVLHTGDAIRELTRKFRDENFN